MKYNIYCDESCHLERDQSDVMVLGAVWCPKEAARQVGVEVRALKGRHGLAPSMEIKWSKVSPAKVSFYLALVDYFLDNALLSFRAVVIPAKSKLRHADFGQAHDDWYYKMHFNLLRAILEPEATYRIYLDIKDTHSADKAAHLGEVLSNSLYDFDRRIVESIQPVRSEQVTPLQLVDLLTGAVCYANRNLSSSPAKNGIVRRLRDRTGYTLTRSTLLKEKKFNVFMWKAQEIER